MKIPEMDIRCTVCGDPNKQGKKGFKFFREALAVCDECWVKPVEVKPQREAPPHAGSHV